MGVAAAFRGVTVGHMPTGRGLALLADVPDRQRRDGPPQLVVRREYSVIAMPVLPWRRHEVGEPVARVFVSAHDELVTKAELNELTAVMRDLAEAQKPTDEAQRRTEWAVKDLAKQVGGLSAVLGGSLEDFACDLVPELLENTGPWWWSRPARKT